MDNVPVEIRLNSLSTVAVPEIKTEKKNSAYTAIKMSLVINSFWGFVNDIYSAVNSVSARPIT